MSMDLITTMAAEQGLDSARYWKTVCNTVIPKESSTEQVVAFLAVANQYGLNPLTKEIYAFPSKGGIQPIVSVDGWLKLANSNPQFDGLETEEIRDGGEIIAVKCTVHRKDRGYPTVATEYMAECRRNTEPWKHWPVRMLTNKAMIQAIRRAFSLAGIYGPDEGQRIADAQDAEAEYHSIDSVSEAAQAATEANADDLKQRLAAAGEPADQKDDGDGENATIEASPPSETTEPDDFEVMGFAALTDYASRVKKDMTPGQRKTAKSAIESSNWDALRALFRSMAGDKS